MIAIVAITLLFRLTPLENGDSTWFVLDAVLITSSVLTLMLICCQSRSNEEIIPTHQEAFTDENIDVSVASTEDATWAMSLSGKSRNVKLVAYVSAFQAASYAIKTSETNLWYNVAGKDSNAHDNNFTFGLERPSWKQELGFAMARTHITGPLTMDVLPNSAEYTVFCLFQLSSLSDVGTTGTLIFIPANGTPLQNGLQVNISCLGACTGSSIKAKVEVQIGNQNALLCNENASSIKTEEDKFVMFDTHVRYLVSVTRTNTNIRVNLFNVESSSARCIPNTILDIAINDDALVYNNQNIIVNGNGINGGTHAGVINGNIMAFGLFSGALKQMDESLVCDHYHRMFLLQDPMVLEAQASVLQAKTSLSCPYDLGTCNVCSNVSQWTNPYQVSKGGLKCMNAINTFCEGNPTHAGCECWDTSNNAFVTDATRKACQTMKSLYSGDDTTMCFEAVHRALENVKTQATEKEKEKHDDEEKEIITSDIIVDLARQENKNDRLHDHEAHHKRREKDCMDDQHHFTLDNNASGCVVCIVCGKTSCESVQKMHNNQTIFQWFFGM